MPCPAAEKPFIHPGTVPIQTQPTGFISGCEATNQTPKFASETKMGAGIVQSVWQQTAELTAEVPLLVEARDLSLLRSVRSDPGSLCF